MDSEPTKAPRSKFYFGKKEKYIGWASIC
jgi:hypothetical protein